MPTKSSTPSRVAVVIFEFDTYKRGDRITDADKIQAIIDEGNADKVNFVEIP